jgi:hypothetical protein
VPLKLFVEKVVTAATSKSKSKSSNEHDGLCTELGFQPSRPGVRAVPEQNHLISGRRTA